MKKSFLLFLIICSLAVSALPKPTGYVNDFANVITPEWRSQLETALSDYQKNSSVEMSIVTVSSLDGDTPENIALQYLTEWGIGKKGKDNGILIFAAIDDRKWRIEVGYGLEGIVTDSIAGRIGRADIVPYFRQGKYGEGLSQTVSDLQTVIGGGEEPSEADDAEAFAALGAFLYMIFIFFAIPAINIFNNKKTRRILFAIFMAPGLMLFFLIPSEMRFFLALWMGFFVLWHFVSDSQRPRKYSGSGIWWGGFGGGGSSGGGGSFGGFGGGGGGGGGAGGGW